MRNKSDQLSAIIIDYLMTLEVKRAFGRP